MIAQSQQSAFEMSIQAFYETSIQGDADTDVPTIFAVDPDPSTGNLVRELVGGDRIDVQSYSSGRAFFAAYDGSQPGCLVLELRIFNTSGFEVQRRIAEQHSTLPVVFVTSGIDVSTAVMLMRQGAVHVLEKPLRSTELLGAIQEALARNSGQRLQEVSNRRVQECLSLLTHKERHFIGLLAEARPTKVIASALSISARAVELRRRSVMDKLGFGSSVELMRFALLAHQRFAGLLSSQEAEITVG